MPLWILALWKNPLVRKLTIYVAIILFALMCLKWYGNHIRESEKPEMRKETIEELNKPYEQQFKQLQQDIAKQTIDSQKQFTDQLALLSQVVAAKNADRMATAQAVGALSGIIARIPGQVATIPAGRLPDEIRKALVDLR